MPNQMIALQSRGPKLPDPASQTARYVNMMNMAKQQEVAERQSAQAAQQMAYATAEEERKKQMFPSTLAKGQSDAESAELDRNAKAAANLKADLGVITSGDLNAITAWRENAVNMLPAWGQYLPPAEKIAQDPKAQLMIAMTIQQIADKTIKTPTSTMEITGATGPLPPNTAVEVSLGGLDGPSITPIKVAGAAQPPAAAPQAPVVPTAAPQTPAGPVPTGKFGETLVVPEASVPLTPYQQDHIRQMQEELGMTNTPASFTPNSMGTPTAGQMTPDMVPAILDSAVNTGVMAQIDLDQMLALAPPQARQGIMDVIRSNKIALQADAPSLAASAMSQQQPMGANPVQTPDAGFAVYRGGQPPQSQTAALDGDMSRMRNTEAQYQSILRRDPTVSPAPGVYNVPTSQVAEKARAERETPGEVYAKEKARARAQREAALEAGPKPLTSAQEQKLRATITKDYKTVNDTLDQMLNPVTGVVAAVNNVRKLSKSQKEWLVGKTNYLPSITDAGQTADTRLGNLTGKVTQMGKVLASLGGAIGPMAVQEWNIVRSFIAELDPAQMSPKALEDQLDIIEAAARGAAERISDAYNNQYIEEFARYPGRFQIKGPTQTPVKKNPAESQLPRIKTDAQWNALKPGTLYIAPNGETKRKR